MNRRTCALAAMGLFAAMLYAGAATATTQRAFVSAQGDDGDPCTATFPCRTLAGALAATVPGGEIYVIDSGRYGDVTITQAVSIINQAGSAILGANIGGNAVTINAGTGDKVVLRGLTIVGAGSGSNGIVFSSGASLSVEDCAFSQFTFGGVLFQPSNSSRLHVSNTRVFNNGPGGVGIYVNPQIPSGAAAVSATFERLEATDDSQAGIFVDGRNSGQSVQLKATIADSVLADSITDGVHAVSSVSGAPTFVMVRNTTLSNNGFGGSSEGGATLVFGHSTLSGNGQASFTNSGGLLLSYGDNNVDGNGSLGPAPGAITFH